MVLRMKSTYKLLSIYLDGKNIPESRPLIKNSLSEDILFGLEMDYCIFDLEIYQRRISGMELLSCKNRDALEEILQLAEPCDYIWILLDFFPDMETVKLLFLKRILQIMRIMQERWKEKRIGLLVEYDNPGQYDMLLNNYYK